MLNRRRLMIAAASAGLSAGLRGRSSTARAETVGRPARLVVGFAPGGSLDTIARVLVEQMKGYAPSLIVDNKPGATGRIALDSIKSSPPDGTAMILTPSAALVLYPHVYKKLAYDPINDFAPVTSVGSVSYDIAVGPRVPDSVKTLQDFVVWCRANPKDAAYGSPGAGSGHHFVGALFARAAGIDLIHVPYKGTAPAIQDLLGGQIAADISVGAHLPLHKAGRIRILATSGVTRSAVLPDVPTFVEAGFQVVASDWFGLVMPAATPAPLIAAINANVRSAIAGQMMQDAMAKFGFTPGGESPADFAAMIRRDLASWGDIVKAAGFTAEE